jgi:hypothetical protein
MFTVSLVDPQPGLPIVHTNELLPTESPVTPDAGSPGVVTEALPAITVHVPVPTAGVLPASVALAAHTVWSDPALAAVGDAALVIVTVSLDEGHDALLMVQTKEFVPTLNPVTPEAGLPGAVTEAPPAMTVHTPVPFVGVLPAKVAEAAHTPKSAPASAVVGDWSRVIMTVSLDDGQVPLLIVQTNVFAPTLNPVTPDAGLDGVVTDAPPPATVQIPLPTAGVLPANVAACAQTV